MPVIFISYRREDSAGHAGRLFDRLRERFGRDRVFLDVVGIQAGVDFVETIDKAVGSCDVLLAVIGREWLSCADKHGRRRLDDPNDFIRAEISAALKRNVRVVPVLVENAEMPPTDELPEELKRLTRRQAVELRDSRWDADVEDLIAVLEGEATHAGTGLPPRAAQGRARGKPVGRRALLWGIGALVAALLAVGAALYFRPPEPRLVRAPDLAGLSLEDAIEKLRVSGFVAGRQDAKQTNDAPARRVLSQRPESGKELEPGTPVDLVYAEPLPPDTPPDTRIEVPNVVGADLKLAMDTIQKAGLKPFRRSESSNEAQLTVLRQDPAAGNRVEKGTRVTLVYAKRLPDTRIEIPNVVGADLKLAMDTIQKAGLEPFRRPESSNEAQFTVLRQDPAAGNRVEKGTRVTLVYAKPEDKVQTTDVYIYYASEGDRGTAERLAGYLRGLKLEGVVYRISLTKPDLATGRVFYPLEEQAGLAKTIAGRAGVWLSKEVYGRETHLRMELDPRVRKSSLILTLPETLKVR